MNVKRLLVLMFTLLLAALLLAPQMMAQSSTTGDVTGTVTDPAGAVITGATVTLKSNANGSTQTASTSDKGFFRFSLLAPGDYTLTVAASGFQNATRTVAVSLGRTNDQDFKMSITAATTVEVTGEAPLLQTDQANVATSYNETQVKLVPNPGNDLSFVAQTAPGAIMNTQSGYGNFSTFGLPATSNLFTLDGMNDNDPFLNLNNSGATNLLLGQNEIAEATVVNNGYSGQYGQLAGSTVNYVTKSGTNRWHGNAIWWWNGRAMNANDWFNNHTSTPKPFDNANQWAASFGGPIQKDKTFFFVDYEGLRVLLPTSAPALIPSPQFETATIAQLNATGLAASVPFYQTMFNLYNGAPGAATASPSPIDPLNPGAGGCGGFFGADFPTNPALGQTVACTLSFRSTASNFTHEWLLGMRFDHVFSEKDRMFARFQTDHGVQATYTDPINPVFNALSTQPEYQGQLSETHIFSGRTANSLVISGQWYSAIFQPPNLAASLAAFPTTLGFSFSDATLSDLGGLGYIWPQGRNVTGYQVVDDVSHTHGNHTFRFGVNYHRNDVSDHDFGLFSSGLLIPFSLVDFYNGGSTGDELLQSFPQKLSQPMALYGLGLYAQDEWRMRPNLTVTVSLRVEHNSNPVCQTNCFASLTQPFTQIALDPAGTVPYNQTIVSGRHQAYTGYNSLLWQPRVGFAYSPWSKTVIRGGVGYFYDVFPAVIVDSFASNPPFDTQFAVLGDNISPAEATNVFADATGANATFQSGFAAGQSAAQMILANPNFTPPNFVVSDKTVKSPQYLEWNLAVQQEIFKNLAVTFNYVGNHGIREPIQNNGLNAFCSLATCPPAGWPGLPTSAPDARFVNVNQVQSTGVSNYNGLTTTVQYRFNGGQLQFNYTYSHALDIISNGGLNQFNLGTSASLLNPQDPFNVRQFNYGNADYDVRHYISMNYYWELPFQKLFHATGAWQKVYRGWVVSGTVFHRTGLPFTVVDTGSTNNFIAGGYGGMVWATQIAPGVFNCGANSATDPTGGPSATPCLLAASFTSNAANFGAQTRNQYRGPGFFDSDFTIMKNTGISKHWEAAQLGIGFQFFNVFNHPNFDQPVNDTNSAFFGSVTRTVNTPTSILGSFLGGDASPRLIQLTVRLTF
jgi:hypothetical protein